MEYTSYEFTSSAGIDYNYDPSSTTKPAFDPYADVPEETVHIRSPERVDYRRDVAVAKPRHSPSPPPIPKAPSQEYTLESQRASTRLSTPTALRKLLILDLNGTLVYRTPHARREFKPPRRRLPRGQGHYHEHYHHPPEESHSQPYTSFQYRSYAPNDPNPYAQERYNPSHPSESYSSYPHYASAPQRQRHFSPEPVNPNTDPTGPRLPNLRNVYPRPYMNVFKDYLFHPATRAWLDTMVWSSAQPHSVADMVDKCFSDKKDDLLAVWARDTLGLKENEYHKKTQTTKDLATPWSKLSITPSLLSTSTSSPSSSTSSPSLPSDPTIETPQAYSAHTTLLLDDSPLKAHLQPWNHLCIREYTGAQRQVDLQCAEREKLLQQRQAQAQAQAEAEVEVEEVEAEVTSGLSPTPTIATHIAPSDPTSETTSPPLPPTGSDPNSSPSLPPTSPPLSPSLPSIPTSPNPLPLALASQPKKRKRNKKKEPKPLPEVEDPLSLGLGGYDPLLLAVIGVLEAVKWEGNVAGWMHAGGLRLASGGKKGHGHGHEPDKRRRVSGEGEGTGIERVEREEEGFGNTNNAAVLENGHGTVETPAPGLKYNGNPSPSLGVGDESSSSSPTPNLGDMGQWFEDLAVLRHWARAGARACEALGIVVVSGIAA